MKAGRWYHALLFASLLDPSALSAGGADPELRRPPGREIMAFRNVRTSNRSSNSGQVKGASGDVDSDDGQGEKTLGDGGSVSGQKRHDTEHKSDNGLNCVSWPCASDDNGKERSESKPNGSFKQRGTPEHFQTHDLHRRAAVQEDLCNGMQFPECRTYPPRRKSAKIRDNPEERDNSSGRPRNVGSPESLFALTHFLTDYVHYYGYSHVKLIAMSHDEELKTEWIRLIRKTPTVYYELMYVNSTFPSTSPPLVSSCLSEKVFKSLAVVKLSSIMELGREEQEKWVLRTRECAWVVLATPLDVSTLTSVTLPLDNQVTFALWPEPKKVQSKRMLSGRVLTQAEMDVEVQFWDAYRAAPSLPLHMKKTGQWYLKDQLARSSDFSRSSRSSTSREDDLSLNALRRRQQAPKSLSDASVKDSKLLSPSASLKRPMASAKSCQGTPSGKGILNLEVDQIGPKSEPKFFDKFREELSKLLKHGSNSPRRKELEDLAELREVPRRKRSSEKMEEKVIRYPPLEMFLRRRNLTGLHLRCVTESWIPFSENRRLANGTTKIGGILEDVFEQMSIILDFTYTCRQPEDHEFGVFDNGSWSGLMGELVEGRADVAVASLDNTYHRTQYVDFPTPIDFIRYTVFMRQPAPNAWANFTRELSPGSWGTLLLTAATFTIALGCIARCRRHPDHELAPADAWFTVFSFMVNQGSWTVTGLPARILLFMLVLTAWVCLAFYTSNLISALAIPSFFPPFNDLHGLLKKKSHKLGLLRGMSEVDRFRLSKDTVLRRVWQEIVSQDPDNLVPTTEMAIAKVLRENFVFVMEEAYYDAVYKSNCQLYQLPIKLFNYGAGIALTKNSTLTKIFSDVLLDLRSSGIVDQSRRRRYSHSLQPCETSSTTRPMGLESIFTAFLLIACGLTLAILFLLLEVYYNGPKGSRRGKRNLSRSQ